MRRKMQRSMLTRYAQHFLGWVKPNATQAGKPKYAKPRVRELKPRMAPRLDAAGCAGSASTRRLVPIRCSIRWELCTPMEALDGSRVRVS